MFPAAASQSLFWWIGWSDLKTGFRWKPLLCVSILVLVDRLVWRGKTMEDTKKANQPMSQSLFWWIGWSDKPWTKVLGVVVMSQSLFWWIGWSDILTQKGTVSVTIVSILVLVDRLVWHKKTAAIKAIKDMSQSLFWWIGWSDANTRHSRDILDVCLNPCFGG